MKDLHFIICGGEILLIQIFMSIKGLMCFLTIENASPWRPAWWFDVQLHELSNELIIINAKHLVAAAGAQY